MVYSECMTEMTQQTERPNTTYSLRAGEERSYTANGVTTRIFYVAGGSFTRVDTRDSRGLIYAMSGTKQFCCDALRIFAKAVAYADQQTEETK